MNVAFLNLKELQNDLKDELQSAAMRVLESGRFVQGAEVAGFEKKFAAYCGTSHAIAVNSGTSALHLSLLAAGVKPGDEVITVPMTFVATVSAIQYTGARVVLVDVDPDTYTMDPEKLEAAITSKTKAIIPVHLYGQPADMEAIMEIARRHGITVVEDACQAHGARVHGRRVGSWGHMACFSFYPSKNLGACGEGGAVVTQDAALDRTIRMLRDWGQESKYHHVVKGFNYRMEELQGAFLDVKLPYLDSWNDARRKAAAHYEEELKGCGIKLPTERSRSTHVYHVYPVLLKDRTQARKTLQLAGIETGIHYPEPVHLMPAFSDLGYGRGSFPVAESIAREELSLPMFPGLERDAIVHVANSLRG